MVLLKFYVSLTVIARCRADSINYKMLTLIPDAQNAKLKHDRPPEISKPQYAMIAQCPRGDLYPRKCEMWKTNYLYTQIYY